MQDSIGLWPVINTVSVIVLVAIIFAKFHSRTIVNECTRLITQKFGRRGDRVQAEEIFNSLGEKLSIRGETLTLRKDMVGVTLLDMLKRGQVALHYPGFTAVPIENLKDLGDREIAHKLETNLRNGELNSCCIHFST
ncbi:MAG: hypothetical protein AAB388_01900 [Patescibacteria group bacterium]